MKLQHITFTGIDARTNIPDLIDIQREFPIVEFGVLTSYHWYENGNRYFDPAYLQNLKEFGGELNLSLHICGSAAHDAAVGEWKKIDKHLFGMLDIFNRIQLNVAAHENNPPSVRLPLYNQEIIIQTNDASNTVLFKETLKQWGSSGNLSLLIDPSGGRGIDSDIHVLCNPGGKIGYAGGINPSNVADKLRVLFESERVGKFWIDMESGVRTDDWFDTDKARMVLAGCRELIKYFDRED